MRLKSLELIGFKSFPDRTTIAFEDGITGIVGPNGAGKSNVVDAIRWVMGEQSAKHLRGANMGDVIFNGTESRPLMGMASVFLTFDNSDGRAPAEYADYSEITVGRRLYRSGESEYFINKTPCRLKDITDLFLGTGLGVRAYAIVEQGMIGQILNAKPEDRRMLIDEAAGISKFKIRKEAALRKMESTKSNIARLSDILNELARQMNSLYRQAKKAERFKSQSGELRELELKVSARQYRDMKAEIEALARNLQRAREAEVSDGSRLFAEDAGIESEKMKLSEMEHELDDAQTSLYEKQNELQLVEAERSYKSKEMDGLEAQIRRWTEETAELDAKVEGWRRELLDAAGVKAMADTAAVSAEEELGVAECGLEARRNEHHEVVVRLEDMRKRFFDCIERVSSGHMHIEQQRRRGAELSGWMAKDQAEMDNLDARAAELQSKIDVRGSDVAGTKQLRLELEQEISAARETYAMQKEELENAEKSAASVKEELQAKRSRLHSLEELDRSREGYHDGVRAILRRREDAEDHERIFGTINDIIETAPQFENAVGAVLGEKLQYVVVRSHEVGMEAVDYLKTAASGRSSFIPVELRGAEASAGAVAGEGVIGPLLEHVSYSDDYRKIVTHLLGDVVLVNDLKNAMNIWGACSSTLVTLDGDVLDPTGVLTGGSGFDASKQLMVHRREIRELSTLTGSLSSRLAAEEELRERIAARVKGIGENIDRLENESRDGEIKQINQEKDLHNLEREAAYYRAQRDKLTVEVAAFAEEQALVRKELDGSRELLEAAERDKADIERMLNDDQRKESELRGEVQELAQRKAELGLRSRTERDKAEAHEKDIQRLVSAVAEAYAAAVQKKLDMLAAGYTIKADKFSVDALQRHLHALVETIGLHKERHSEIRGRYDEGLSAVREKEASLREIRKRHDELVKNVHEIELSFTQRQEKLNYLVREMFERYRVNLEASFEEYQDGEIDIEESAGRVAELKEKIEKIGAVNVDAIKEYDELKVRHDFLKEQLDDLSGSLEDLHRAIQKINKTSRARFQEAFDSVNERFQKLFPKLFQGGKAFLRLTDEEHLLECGVDIIAQPPGKKLQSITLLSGGEKALTAIALVFAMFLHRPSPFCLLDEVDAPLDDANIDRFNEIIREMTRLSQFILITHNKRTMELADTLYGITMEERGISKIISISLTDRKENQEAA